MNEDFIITKIDRIIYVGEDEYEERKTSFNFDLKSNELIFHLTGESQIHFNNKVFNTKPYNIRFLPKGKVFRYDVERKMKSSCIDIFFQTDKPISDEAFVIDSNENKNITALFKKAFSVWVAKGEGYNFECISLLYKIFAEISKQNYIPEKQFAHIKPVADYINNNFLSKNITTQDLLNLTDIGYTYLKSLFIKRYGLPPKKYIIQLKINHACDLIECNQYSITQIAEMCGFSDVYFFSRQFKEYVGISPTEFAKKYKSSK